MPDCLFNRVTRTAHQLNSDDHSKSACGMKMSMLTYEFASGPYALEGCALCWRPGCCNWEAVLISSPAAPDLGSNYSPTSVVPEGDGDVLALPEDDDGF